MKRRSGTLRPDFRVRAGLVPILITFLFHAAGVAMGQGSRAELERQRSRYVKAQRESDFPTVLKIVTNDFMLLSPQGKVDRKALERVAKMPPRQFGGTKQQQDTIQRITIKGVRAMVIADQNFTSKYTDRSGGKHRMTSSATFKEQWIHRNGAWMLRRVEIVKHSEAVDGKTVGSSR